MAWLTIQTGILLISSANTIGVVLLLVFYCFQIRFLKKKLLGLGVRPAMFKGNSTPEMLRERPRANSWVFGQHNPPRLHANPSAGYNRNITADESDSSTSSVNKYPVPPLPRAATNTPAQHQPGPPPQLLTGLI